MTPFGQTAGGLRLALMQPYFFPYLGYFSLIRRSDRWVVFDSAQFIRRGWIDRNRILHPSEGWLYIRVPLEKCPLSTPINQVKVRNSEPWREKLLSQLGHYKRNAPHYKQVVSFLKEALDTPVDGIAALNVHLLEKTCGFLEIPFPYTLFSALPIAGMTVNSPDEWGLQAAKAFGAAEYLNAPGGINLYDSAKYERAGLRLTFVRTKLKPYDQNRSAFEGGLSILDAMMFNHPREIREMLDDVEFIPGGAIQPVHSCVEELQNG